MKKITIRVSDDEYEKLKGVTLKQRLSIQACLLRLINDEIEKSDSDDSRIIKKLNYLDKNINVLIEMIKNDIEYDEALYNVNRDTKKRFVRNRRK